MRLDRYLHENRFAVGVIVGIIIAVVAIVSFSIANSPSATELNLCKAIGGNAIVNSTCVSIEEVEIIGDSFENI